MLLEKNMNYLSASEQSTEGLLKRARICRTALQAGLWTFIVYLGGITLLRKKVSFECYHWQSTKLLLGLKLFTHLRPRSTDKSCYLKAKNPGRRKMWIRNKALMSEWTLLIPARVREGLYEERSSCTINSDRLLSLHNVLKTMNQQKTDVCFSRMLRSVCQFPNLEHAETKRENFNW